MLPRRSIAFASPLILGLRDLFSLNMLLLLLLLFFIVIHVPICLHVYQHFFLREELWYPNQEYIKNAYQHVKDQHQLLNTQKYDESNIKQESTSIIVTKDNIVIHDGSL